MRGIFNIFKNVSFQVREFGFGNALAHALMEGRASVNDHFEFRQHPDGLGQGAVAYVRLPFTRLSAMTEWSAVSLGWGVERTEEGQDFYCGRLKVSLCTEQGEMYRSARNGL